VATVHRIDIPQLNCAHLEGGGNAIGGGEQEATKQVF